MKLLECNSITNSIWTEYKEKDSQNILPGIAVAKYIRFNRMINLQILEIYPNQMYGQKNKKNPKHLKIEFYAYKQNKWETILEDNLPPFLRGKPHKIKINNIITDNIRIILDKNHPFVLGYGEAWSKPEIIPFTMLDNVKCFGEFADSNIYEPVYNPPLKKGDINPSAPTNMQIFEQSHQIRYYSPFFSIGFSLKRPIITHLGWDSLGKEIFANDNLIAAQRVYEPEGDIVPIDSGPFLSTLKGDIFPRFWTGNVEVYKNRVIYSNLKAIDGLLLNLEFEVHSRGVNITVEQNCKENLYALEAEIIRFVWEGRKSITGTEGIPIQSKNRTGVVPSPVRFNSPGYGILGVVSDIPSLIQVDTWRAKEIGWAGLIFSGKQDDFGILSIAQGVFSNKFKLNVTEPIKPIVKEKIDNFNLPEGIERHWGSNFGFRAELSGNSDNSMSTSCLCVQSFHTDTAAYTEKPIIGPHPIEMARYTITLALKGGIFSYSNRNFSLDSDPNIISSAGRIFQIAPDKNWLIEIWPFLCESIKRILKSINNDGLVVCKSLEGNAFSNNWSSNAMDCISFGNLDAYSNAFSFRALQNAQALAKAVGETKIASLCKTAANNLKKIYFDTFFNSETGWLAGWKSKDGKLHDYGFVYINAMAICYGLIEEKKAFDILNRLEEKRKSLELDYFYYGIPLNLIPIRREDQPLEVEFLPGKFVKWNKRTDGLDRFGVYINGAFSTFFSEYYLSALSKYGFKETADQICKQINESLAQNRIVGGINTGTEFHTHEGRPCGYEGIMASQFNVLIYIAKHLGFLKTLTPEWWPSLE
jgi:hypothetical protein